MNNVNHPNHYNCGKVECIDGLESALGEEGFKSFCVGNVIKYAWRYKHKKGLEDLNKAKWYLQEVIDKIEEEMATKSTASED